MKPEIQAFKYSYCKPTGMPINRFFIYESKVRTSLWPGATTNFVSPSIPGEKALEATEIRKSSTRSKRILNTCSLNFANIRHPDIIWGSNWDLILNLKWYHLIQSHVNLKWELDQGHVCKRRNVTQNFWTLILQFFKEQTKIIIKQETSLSVISLSVVIP